jgi:hypothetical protein
MDEKTRSLVAEFAMSDKLPERLGDLMALADHYQRNGRIPFELLRAIENQLNAERSGVGHWQMATARGKARFIIHIGKRIDIE